MYMIVTWANPPYTEVGKMAIELPTLEVLTRLFLWFRTADLGSSMASFQHFRTFRHRTADLGSSMAAFQHFAQSLILKMS